MFFGFSITPALHYSGIIPGITTTIGLLPGYRSEPSPRVWILKERYSNAAQSIFKRFG
jgi:hypothetical protein